MRKTKGGNKMIVAVDGPAGSGKGTVTKRIEKELGFLNLDTGATYRCVALATLKNNVKLEETEKIIQIANEINIEIDITTIIINKEIPIIIFLISLINKSFKYVILYLSKDSLFIFDIYVKNLFSTIKLILSDITIITDIMTKAK